MFNWSNDLILNFSQFSIQSLCKFILCTSGCENGYVLPIDSMDLVSQWNCSVCGQKMSVESVNETISHCFNILYNRKWTLEDAEKMLPQLLQKLHPNNNMS